MRKVSLGAAGSAPRPLLQPGAEGVSRGRGFAEAEVKGDDFPAIGEGEAAEEGQCVALSVPSPSPRVPWLPVLSPWQSARLWCQQGAPVAVLPCRTANTQPYPLLKEPVGYKLTRETPRRQLPRSDSY